MGKWNNYLLSFKFANNYVLIYELNVVLQTTQVYK